MLNKLCDSPCLSKITLLFLKTLFMTAASLCTSNQHKRKPSLLHNLKSTSLQGMGMPLILKRELNETVRHILKKNYIDYNNNSM